MKLARAFAASVLTAALVWVSPAAHAALSKPNVILVLTDDQTFDALPEPGATPQSVQTMPYLESALADPNDHWVQFPNFFFNDPLCCPSRATILTGQYDFHTGVQNNEQGSNLDESQTLAVWLHAAGYRTGLVGKYLNDYPFGRGDYTPPGWDEWFAHTGKGDLGYYQYTLDENGTRVSYGSGQNDYSTDNLTNVAINDVIDTTPLNQPFFLDLSLAAPHANWKPAPRYLNAFPGLVPNLPADFNETDVSDKPAWVKNLPLLDQSTIEQDKAQQYRTILAEDDALKSLVDAVSARGQLNNTVIVFMTDNGLSFGEHRLQGKRCPYDVCLQSPFFIRYPGATRGSVGNLVSNIDVAPTIADLAGVSPTPAFDGVSLMPLVQGLSPPWRSAVLIHNLANSNQDTIPTWWGIRTHRYTYVEYPTGEKELYDLSTDPWELNNVAGQPS